MILVTGGAGYIGSHTCVELLNAGYEVVVVDNFYNSCAKSLERVEEITGKTVKFYEADLLDKAAVKTIFDNEKIDAVIHFAGYKAVGESVHKPLEYYSNNLGSTLNLCEAMRDHGVKKLIFSSSATVYGDQPIMPITEAMEKQPATNPYGWTKWMIEEILKGVFTADPEWSIMLLRYFNPIGAHESGLIGEDPKGIPNNLVPYVAQTAIGIREYVHVYGDDYDTPDGTGVRDYIHVVDLAKGHLAALRKLMEGTGVNVYNLGTGRGYSVLDVIKAYSKACGHDVPYKIEGRRPGDLATCYSDPKKAEEELGWKAQFDIEDMCRDSYRWQSMNPNGFGA